MRKVFASLGFVSKAALSLLGLDCAADAPFSYGHSAPDPQEQCVSYLGQEVCFVLLPLEAVYVGSDALAVAVHHLVG